MALREEKHEKMSTQTLEKPPFWCIKCGKRVKKAVVHMASLSMEPENTVTIELKCHKEVEVRQYTPAEYIKFANTGLTKQFHRCFEPKPPKTTHH